MRLAEASRGCPSLTVHLHNQFLWGSVCVHTASWALCESHGGGSLAISEVFTPLGEALCRELLIVVTQTCTFPTRGILPSLRENVLEQREVVKVKRHTR